MSVLRRVMVISSEHYRRFTFGKVPGIPLRHPSPRATLSAMPASPKPTSFTSIFLAIGAAVVLIFGMGYISDHAAGGRSSGESTTAPTTDMATTKLAVACAKDDSDMADVLRAYQRSDTAALAGLIGRGRAVLLAKDTEVRVIYRDSGIAKVRVLSGTYSGEMCSVWGKWVE